MTLKLFVCCVLLPWISNAFSSTTGGKPRSSFLGATTSLASTTIPYYNDDWCHHRDTIIATGTTPTMLLENNFARKSILWAAVGVVSSAVVTTKALQRFVWKYPKRDVSQSEPLPVGPYPVCPLFQDNARESSPAFGPGYFFYKRSKQLKHPKLWKFLTANKEGQRTPTVIVSNYQIAKEMLNMEFSQVQSNVVPFSSKVIGTHSLRLANNREEHTFLRKLVGAGMTPSNVAKMIPAIQSTAEGVLVVSSENSWKMHDICTDFTLDLAVNSIIGLELGAAEIPVFRQALSDWMEGIFLADATKALVSRVYMVNKIEAHIENLRKESGAYDSKANQSALSTMVFATDEANGHSRLTNDQIIDNTLLLILAGTDTSAGTLTMLMFILGLHPKVYAQVVQEQQKIIKKHGTVLSKELLDTQHMPYLEAVIKEALRIRPVVGGSMRGAKETIILGGKQVPAGSFLGYDRFLTHLLDPITFQEDESHMDVKEGFQPERWLDAKTKPIEYIPFGIGPRFCLGSELAMTEMKIFLAVLGRRLPEVKLLEPRLGQPIEWKEKCLVPVPKNGVIVDSSLALKK